MDLSLGESTFFTKLLFRFFIITMIVILIFGLSVIYYFKTFYIQQKRTQINKNSTAVLEYLARSFAKDDKQEVVNWLNIIGKLNEGQVWLINEQGYLTFSYPYSFSEEKRFSRYEGIFEGNTISREVTTSDFENTMLLVGMPVKYDDKVIAALLVFTPIKEINATVNQIAKLMGLISIFSLFLILFITYFWSRSLSNPLRNIGNIAAEISKGKFGKKVEIEDKRISKEVNMLADSINIMSDKLEQTIRSLIEEKSKLQHVLAGMEEGIIAVNNEGKIILINQSASDLFNLETDVKGEHIKEVVDEPKIKAAFKTALNDEQGDWQEIVFKKENTKQYILFHCTPIKLENESFQGGVALFQDISQRYRFEKLQEEFVANVSHELKAPLSSIKGSVELLLDGVINDPKKQEQYLEMILEESNSLTHLIEETLILAEIDSGGLEVNKDRVNLKTLFENLVLFFNNIKKEKQKLELDVAGDIFISANKEKIRQVLINLLSNSVKFSPVEGTIKLEAEKFKKEVKIMVKDNGTGIPEEELENIWERFYKVDKARTPGKKSSSGLGLAIVKQIIEEHQGRVFVESISGEGSCFGFFISCA